MSAEDVAAALDVLEQAAIELETADPRIHARAAHALVAQALAERVRDADKAREEWSVQGGELLMERHGRIKAELALAEREERLAALHAGGIGHLHRCARINGAWSCAPGCAVARAERAEADALAQAARHADCCVDREEIATLRSQLADVQRQAIEREEALRALFLLVDEGWLVRNTSNDGHLPSFLAESQRLVKVLATAKALLAP